MFANPQAPPVARESVRLITPHIPRVTLMYCGISVSGSSNITHIIHIKLSISENNSTRTTYNYRSRHWLFILVCDRVYVALEATQYWPFVHLNFSHPRLFHAVITFSLFLSFPWLPPFLSLFLAICPATAAPSITVLPDCIPLIPTGFLWLEQEWALLATKLHLGVIPVYAICVFSLLHCFLNPLDKILKVIFTQPLVHTLTVSGHGMFLLRSSDDSPFLYDPINHTHRQVGWHADTHTSHAHVLPTSCTALMIADRVEIVWGGKIRRESFTDVEITC